MIFAACRASVTLVTGQPGGSALDPEGRPLDRSVGPDGIARGGQQAVAPGRQASAADSACEAEAHRPGPGGALEAPAHRQPANARRAVLRLAGRSHAPAPAPPAGVRPLHPKARGGCLAELVAHPRAEPLPAAAHRSRAKRLR